MYFTGSPLPNLRRVAAARLMALLGFLARIFPAPLTAEPSRGIKPIPVRVRAIQPSLSLA